MDSPAPCPSGIGCGSIEPAASSGASLPSHGLKIEGVTPVELEEENKTDLPTTPKWQIGLFLWQKVARRETERSAASAKRAATTHRGIPKGAALGAPLVTFPATGKSPGVEGRSALPMGGVQRREHRRCGPPRYCAYSSQSCAKVQNAFSAVLRWAVAGVMVSRSPFHRRSTVTSASSRRICSITLAGMLV